MTDMDDPGYVSAIARLRRGYIESLGSKADELCEAMARCPEATPSTESELAHLIHRLAGTAGSYGVLDVSQRAAQLELRLDAGMTRPELAAELSTLVELMRQRARNG